jgi:hypothetical protein
MEVSMITLARALSRTIGRDVDPATLETMATVASAFAFVAILYISSGLDLSAGFF